MIKSSVHFFKPANKVETKKITTDSSESFLSYFQPAAGHIFSVANLWNIRRKGKKIYQDAGHFKNASVLIPFKVTAMKRKSTILLQPHWMRKQ